MKTLFKRYPWVAWSLATVATLMVAGRLVLADRAVAARPRQFKVCTLLVPTPADPFALDPRGTQLPANSQTFPGNPWMWYVLQRRGDVKPDGWEFSNPAAAGAVSDVQRLRWNAVVNGNSGLAVGQRLTQSLGPYWEVTLAQENFDRLLEMDIIYMPVWRAGNQQGTIFTEEQRKMLTRLVDSGVLLWVDWGTSFANNPVVATQDFTLGPFDNTQTVTRPNPFFMPFDFLGGATANNVPPGVRISIPHPLIDGYFKITDSETRTLGIAVNSQVADARGPRGINPSATFGYPGPPLTQVLPNPAVNGGSPYICAARYGSGFVVATAGNIGGAISNQISVNNVPLFQRVAEVPATVDLIPADVPDMQFAYNVAWWRGEFNHPQKSPRHLASGSEPLQGLIERWSDRSPGVARLAVPVASPLIVDNMLIALQPLRAPFGMQLAAYEIEPANRFSTTQIDPNAFPPDDGVADYSLGASYDALARANFSTWAQSPTYLSGMVYGENGGIGGLAVAGQVGSDGAAWIVATPNSALSPNLWLQNVGGTIVGGNPVNLPQRPCWSAPAYSSAPFPTVYLTGGAPGAAGGGMVAGYRVVPQGGQVQLVPEWHFPPGNAPDSIGAIVSGPVPAQITDKRTGAIDRVVFFTHLHNNKGPGGFGGIVDSTISEPLAPAPPAGQPIANFTELVPIRRTERWDPQRPCEIRIVNRTGICERRLTFPIGAIPAQLQFNVKGQPGRMAILTSLLTNGTNFATLGFAGYTVLVDYFNLRQQDQNLPTLGSSAPRRFTVPAFFTPGTSNQGQTGIAGGITVGRDDRAYYGTGRGYITALSIQNSTATINWKARIFNDSLGVFAGSNNVDINPFLGTGLPNPTYLADHAFVNTPAFGQNVVVFASREGLAGNGIVYVFEADATVSFKLPASLPPPLTPVQAQQLELSTYDEAGNEQRIPRDQFAVDTESGSVTFRDMRTFTMNLSQSTRPAGLGGRLGVPINVRIGNISGQGFVPVPLVYYFSAGRYDLTASPVISGDRIYITGRPLPGVGGSGILFELPIDPRKVDASFGQRNPGQHSGLDLAQYPTLVRAREIGQSAAAPAIASGILGMASSNGVGAYHSPSILISDNHRIVEAAGDSTMTASTDAVTKQTLQNSDTPIPTDPQFTVAGGQPIVTNKKFLERPSKAVRLSRGSSLTSVFLSTSPAELPQPGVPDGVSEGSEVASTSTLVADTGNHRVVEFNPSGKVIYEVTEFQDPFKILPAGESLQLKNPTDIQRWVDTETDTQADLPGNQQVQNPPPLLVFHTLICDNGNARVLEIVDKIRWRHGRFDPNSFVIQAGQVDFRNAPFRWYHVLAWSSQTNVQGVRCAYRNAQRILWARADGSYIPDPRYVPRQPTPDPPYLPLDPQLTATVASVNGQQLFLPFNSYPGVAPPVARLGGDTICFLIGRRWLDPGGGVIHPASGDFNMPFRAPDPANQDRYLAIQGAIDATKPLLHEIYPEQDLQANEPSVHTLNGIVSIQRTVRRDIKFNRRGQPLAPAQYYLIADAGGIFEFRLEQQMLDGSPGAPDPQHQARLAWAFLRDDYAYTTGAGNANAAQIRSAASGQYQGAFFRYLTPASARWLSNGTVLITSRTVGTAAAVVNAFSIPGADVFMLRPDDFIPYYNRPGGGIYNPAAIALHGWIPDAWVLAAFVPPNPPPPPPSVVWRTPGARNPNAPPTSVVTGAGPSNPLELFGTYTPQQPTYADLIF